MSDAPRTIDLQWIKALSPVIEEHCIDLLRQYLYIF